MNPQGKNGIDWCDYTWSPVTGCLHGCFYCYARRLARRLGTGGYSAKPTVARPGEVFPAGFSPTFYPHRLSEPARIKKPSRIFAVSAGDLFGEWVPGEWIRAVLAVARQCSRHTFILLTKTPPPPSGFLFSAQRLGRGDHRRFRLRGRKRRENDAPARRIRARQVRFVRTSAEPAGRNLVERRWLGDYRRHERSCSGNT